MLQLAALEHSIPVQIGMPNKLSPVRDHIRLMETRIEQQAAEVNRLRQLGQDTTAGERRLFLLHRALEEMRIQLGHLSPTDLDARRADVDAAMRVLSGMRKTKLPT
jgi:hypothetical protein